MRVHKRTEITIETNEVLVVRRTKVYRGWCPHCARKVDMVELPEARAMAGMSVESVDLAGSAKWHLFEEQEPALVCLESVLRAMAKK